MCAKTSCGSVVFFQSISVLLVSFSHVTIYVCEYVVCGTENFSSAHLAISLFENLYRVLSAVHTKANKKKNPPCVWERDTPSFIHECVSSFDLREHTSVRFYDSLLHIGSATNQHNYLHIMSYAYVRELDPFSNAIYLLRLYWHSTNNRMLRVLLYQFGGSIVVVAKRMCIYAYSTLYAGNG